MNITIYYCRILKLYLNNSKEIKKGYTLKDRYNRKGYNN